MRALRWTVFAALAAHGGLSPAAETPTKALGPDAKGKVYASKAKDGLAYEFHVPQGYDREKGANLTVVLHGSNLDRRWTFANHPAGEFRPDDVVVSPDGTTSNGKGGFNSLNDAKDLKRLRDLLAEVKTLVKVRQTFLYGHSQGSFFALLYAGTYPEDVDGTCAQASGAWTNTPMGKPGHRQAIGLMHGTDDPVVPYGQSVGALEAYREAGYPMVRLRSLAGWNHWPEATQAGSVLAWCEGMTTTDPERAVAAFGTLLAATKGAADYGALHDVARRLSGGYEGVAAPEGLSDKDRARAAEVAAKVEALAAKHGDEVRKALKRGKGGKPEVGPWAGHLRRLLDEFDGVPGTIAFREELAEVLSAQKKAASDLLGDFWRHRAKSPDKAFAEGVRAVRDAFLDPNLPMVVPDLEAWEKKASALKIPKPVLKEFQEVVPAWREAREKGGKDFADVNREAGRFE